LLRSLKDEILGIDIKLDNKPRCKKMVNMNMELQRLQWLRLTATVVRLPFIRWKASSGHLLRISNLPEKRK
jgi:hypothetical protein